VAVPVASTPSQPSEMKPFACANIRLLPKGEYLKAADVLTKAEKDEATPMGSLHQFASVAVSFLTNRAETPPASPTAADRSDLAKLSRAELPAAIPEIVARARRTSIVILNEEHQSLRDRSFALEVARALRPLGYSILALEGFHRRPTRLSESARRSASPRTATCA
jgi:hypothetical protein